MQLSSLMCLMLAAAIQYCHATCVGKPTDVLIMVDSSTGDDAGYQSLLDFSVNVTKDLDIGPYDYKVGMIIFSNSYRRIFYLRSYDTTDDVTAAIAGASRNAKNLPTTDLSYAIGYVNNVMVSTSYGHRHGADTVLLVLLTTPSTHNSLVVSRARTLRNKTGATVIAVGVGADVSDADLQAVASDPQHVIKVADFSALDTALMHVVLEICPADWQTALPPTGLAATTADCPAAVPRDQYLQVFRGVCYEFQTRVYKTWAEAQAYCSGNGGRLVTVKDAETNFYMQNELSTTYRMSASFWLGLKELQESGHGNDGVYRWVDGSYANYTNFGDTVGHEKDKDCIAIVPQLTSSDAGRWREYPCDNAHTSTSETGRLHFVCEYMTGDTGGVTSPTTAAPKTDTPAPTSILPTTPAPTTVAPTSLPPTTDVPTTLTPTFADTVTPPATPTPTTPTPTSTLGGPATPAPTTVTIIPTLGPAGTLPPKTTLVPLVTGAPTTPAPTEACPPFTCGLDCGLDGYQTDAATGCQLCLCDV